MGPNVERIRFDHPVETVAYLPQCGLLAFELHVSSDQYANSRLADDLLVARGRRRCVPRSLYLRRQVRKDERRSERSEQPEHDYLSEGRAHRQHVPR